MNKHRFERQLSIFLLLIFGLFSYVDAVVRMDGFLSDELEEAIEASLEAQGEDLGLGGNGGGESGGPDEEEKEASESSLSKKHSELGFFLALSSKYPLSVQAAQAAAIRQCQLTLLKLQGLPLFILYCTFSAALPVLPC